MKWTQSVCVDCMFPCYSLLSMKVISLYMISAPPPIIVGGLNLRIGGMQGQDIFSHLWEDKLLWEDLKYMGSNVYYYTFIISFLQKQPTLRKVKNFFRKCECISCYLAISLNLLKRSFRKTSLFVLIGTGIMEEGVLLAAQVCQMYICCSSCDQSP